MFFILENKHQVVKRNFTYVGTVIYYIVDENVTFWQGAGRTDLPTNMTHTLPMGVCVCLGVCVCVCVRVCVCVSVPPPPLC